MSSYSIGDGAELGCYRKPGDGGIVEHGQGRGFGSRNRGKRQGWVIMDWDVDNAGNGEGVLGWGDNGGKGNGWGGRRRGEEEGEGGLHLSGLWVLKAVAQ
jgi:hypothetical protein